MSGSPKSPAARALHPRNRHAGSYDMARLAAASPELRPFLRQAPHGGTTVDFSDPAAVKALNRALLLEAYGIRGWDIPVGYLCPPIPGRADYLHYLADLLAEGGDVPRGTTVRVLDVGVGANLIYPLVGHKEYAWAFVGTDLDGTALEAAARILKANPGLERAIQLRRQPERQAIFQHVVTPTDRFSLSLCNPPFHASLREVREASQAKWRKLGLGTSSARNFGGQGAELWCPGGEVGFIRQMIEESAGIRAQVAWFTTLVSSSANLPAVQRALRKVEPLDVRIVPMAQGQKQSRFVAWTFLDAAARQAFRAPATGQGIP